MSEYVNEYLNYKLSAKLVVNGDKEVFKIYQVQKITFKWLFFEKIKS